MKLFGKILLKMRCVGMIHKLYAVFLCKAVVCSSSVSKEVVFYSHWRRSLFGSHICWVSSENMFSSDCKHRNNL